MSDDISKAYCDSCCREVDYGTATKYETEMVDGVCVTYPVIIPLCMDCGEVVSTERFVEENAKARAAAIDAARKAVTDMDDDTDNDDDDVTDVDGDDDGNDDDDATEFRHEFPNFIDDMYASLLHEYDRLFDGTGLTNRRAEDDAEVPNASAVDTGNDDADGNGDDTDGADSTDIAPNRWFDADARSVADDINNLIERHGKHMSDTMCTIMSNIAKSAHRSASTDELYLDADCVMMLHIIASSAGVPDDARQKLYELSKRLQDNVDASLASHMIDEFDDIKDKVDGDVSVKAEIAIVSGNGSSDGNDSVSVPDAVKRLVDADGNAYDDDADGIDASKQVEDAKRDSRDAHGEQVVNVKNDYVAATDMDAADSADASTDVTASDVDATSIGKKPSVLNEIAAIIGEERRRKAVGESGDGGIDGNNDDERSVSRRIVEDVIVPRVTDDEYEQEELKLRLDRAKDTVVDAAETVGYGIARGARRIKQSATDAYQHVTRGYSAIELWNMDDFLLDRYAEIFEKMSRLDYGRGNEWYKNGLASVAQIFVDYKTWMDLFYAVSLESTTQRRSRTPKLMVTHEELRSGVAQAWAWVGRNVMSPDAPKPVRSKSARDLEARLTGIADSVVSGGRSLAHAVQRAVLGYDSESMHSFAYVELKRLSEMLGRLAECSHGYPFEYAGPQLYRDYDGEFADAPYWCLLGNDKAGIEVMTRTDDGLAWRQKTNAEMGVEYAAWTSDLHAASVALGLYADWVIRQRGYMRHIGDIERIAAGSKPVDAVDYVGRRLNDGNGERSIGYDAGGRDGEGARSSSIESDITKSFEMTWKWLGDNFESLWD